MPDSSIASTTMIDPIVGYGNSTILYNPEFEFLLKENGEQAEIYSVLHEMAYVHYKRQMDLFNIPLIFTTAVIGFITGIGLTYPYINIILGAGSVMVSILKSILAYKKLSERSENHRICSLQFSQVSKEIKLELSLRREDRLPVKQMLHIVKVKLKNLLEVAELVEDFIIEKFKTLYPHCKQTHARSLPSNFYGLAQFEIQTTKDQLEYINDKLLIDVEIKQKEQKRQELIACEMEEIERKRQNDTELISFRLKNNVKLKKRN